jgi:hypothetical protein
VDDLRVLADDIGLESEKQLGSAHYFSGRDPAKKRRHGILLPFAGRPHRLSALGAHIF